MTSTARTIHIEPETVRQQIERFLSAELRDGEITIGLLRYGAHLPHIYQRAARGFGVQPVTLLLSHMLEFFPRSWYKGRRFLILDDSVYRGVSMREAIAKLERCGVPRDHYRTAALAIHEGADQSAVDVSGGPPLSHHEYVAWKECLTAVVRDDVRPTERDHPLYYFSSPHLRISRLVDTARSLGAVHVGDTDMPTLFKFALTIDPRILEDVRLPGVTIAAPCKIRFYCDQRRSGEEWHVTAVPIVATEIDMDAFGSEGFAKLGEMLGLPTGFAETAATDIVGDRKQMLYFFANRGLAALMLSRCLSQLTAGRGADAVQLISVPPQNFDGLVSYCFPTAYQEVFHPRMYNLLDAAIATSADRSTPGYAFADPARPRSVNFRHDPFLPDSTQIACIVSKQRSPAEWDGSSWQPIAGAVAGVTYRELLAEFGDPVFVSKALDELLDDGLLRARDAEVSSGTFGRLFIPGGEYRAIEVLRLASAWTAEPMIWTDERESPE